MQATTAEGGGYLISPATVGGLLWGSRVGLTCSAREKKRLRAVMTARRDLPPRSATLWMTSRSLRLPPPRPEPFHDPESERSFRGAFARFLPPDRRRELEGAARAVYHDALESLRSDSPPGRVRHLGHAPGGRFRSARDSTFLAAAARELDSGEETVSRFRRHKQKGRHRRTHRRPEHPQPRALGRRQPRHDQALDGPHRRGLPAAPRRRNCGWRSRCTSAGTTSVASTARSR